MTGRERKICERVNNCLQTIVDETAGSAIDPENIRQLELACFDFAKTMPVSQERANFAVEIMHNIYQLGKEREKYPYIDMLEAIVYLNFEFQYSSDSKRK